MWCLFGSETGFFSSLLEEPSTTWGITVPAFKQGQPRSRGRKRGAPAGQMTAAANHLRRADGCAPGISAATITS
jgi:hypothetical protein